jgi:uncharacterized protein YcaQ
MMTLYPASVLRLLALQAQGLHNPNSTDTPPTPESLTRMVRQIGCVQIDTLQVVRRSQYLVLWSRLGTYDPADFDRLQSGSDRQLFEGWQHAASIIPLEEYRYQMPHQRDLREHPSNWYNRWLTEQSNPQVIDIVRQRIRQEGALRVSDFERGDHPGGAWWNWRPAKVALEYLFAYGELMIDGRAKFQRVYDLTERILPSWVDTREPTVAERDRFWVERGAKALGVCLPRHAGDYTWMKVTRSRPIVEALLKEKVLLPITGKMDGGSTVELLIHCDNLSLLEQAADGVLKAERTTFISPFDNLLWANRRDELFWGFHQALECYVPAARRVYGYFSLPILHKDRLVGRFDPKLDRKTGTLILKSLFLEPGVRARQELVDDVAAAMRDFMQFHQAQQLVIERSEPVVFGKKLRAKFT